MELDENLGSFKSLEDVHLKATQDIEANGISFSEGETIALFKSIQIFGLQEFRSYIAARGGFDNRAHVFWENTKSVSLSFSQGVFSDLQFGILNNANVLKVEQAEPILITKIEQLESNEAGYIYPKYYPEDQIFVYNKETGEKMPWSHLSNFLNIYEPFTDVIVSYRYNYMGGASVAKIGQQFTRGFLELEGKTRVKDDTSGLITTGIIRIPKLKLMSGLSIRLGMQANPVVGNFIAEGIPVGSRNGSYAVEIDFLNNDIDSDM